jgi:hypothetical protein
VTTEALLTSEVKSKITSRPRKRSRRCTKRASRSWRRDLEQVGRRSSILGAAARDGHADFRRAATREVQAADLPTAPKVEVATGDLEPRGPANAPITLIAFSDYECPYCKRAETTVEEVLKAYPDKIRYYHRDFPLDFHANARPAAIAARCANEQGKFWPYRTALFTSAELSADRSMTPTRPASTAPSSTERLVSDVCRSDRHDMADAARWA